MGGGFALREAVPENGPGGYGGERSEDRVKGLIKGGVGVGANQRPLTVPHGVSHEGADHFGFAGARWAPEKEKVMGQRAHERVELCGIEWFVRHNLDVIRQASGGGV